MSLVFCVFFGIFTAMVVALFATTTSVILALLCLNYVEFYTIVSKVEIVHTQFAHILRVVIHRNTAIKKEGAFLLPFSYGCLFSAFAYRGRSPSFVETPRNSSMTLRFFVQ